MIANPPYIRIQTLQEFSPIEAEYLKANYTSAASGNFDIYICFVERGLSALRQKGKLGFILPSKFFQTDYGTRLRSALVKSQVLEKIIDFSHLQVFDGPTTYTCLLFLGKEERERVTYGKITHEDALQSLSAVESTIPLVKLSSGPWVFARREQRMLFEKVAQGKITLGEIAERISRGSSTGADDVFIVKKTTHAGFYLTKDGDTVRLESGVLRVPLYASDYTRYLYAPACEEAVIFPYVSDSDVVRLISERDLKTKYPRAYEYLRKRQRRLNDRRQFSTWYGFSAPRNLKAHDSADILVPLLANRGLFSEYSSVQERFCLMASGGFSITIGGKKTLSPKFVLGLCNSELLFAYLHSISNIFRGGWITCTKQYVKRLPIRSIDFSNPADKARHDKMVTLVERMIELNKRKHFGKLAPSQIDRTDREIAATDEEIDNLVYELYGITDAERKIIEGG